MEKLFAVEVDGRVGVSSAAHGKLAEHLAIAQLLERGHEVAVPVVDDDGVDLVVDCRWRVQVKNSSRRLLETLPGYSYPAFMWSKVGSNTTADVFLLFGGSSLEQEWFVVPAEVFRRFGVKSSVTYYHGSTRGIGPAIREYADAWHVFDA